MDCVVIDHALEIIHNLSIVAVLLTTFYFGSKQVNKSEVKQLLSDKEGDV